MMTIDEVRAELAHLREVPARLRLERLMRDKGGLVDILDGILERLPDPIAFAPINLFSGVHKNVPCASNVGLVDETLPGAYGKHTGTQQSEYQKMIEAKVTFGNGVIPVGSPGATGATTLSEAMSKPAKRKRGRPARRVESGGEA